MSEYKVAFKNDTVIISGLDHFKPELVFDCGQCFNFEVTEDGGFSGVVLDRVVTVYPVDESTFKLCNVDEKFFSYISSYFCLDDDYDTVCRDIISSLEKEGRDTDVMKKAMEAGRGIRLMKQDKWQTLCSFIISQNNNIPRIKKIIGTLSREFGTPFTYEGKTYYTFPTAKALYEAGEDAIFECKTGFRAKYIYDAASRVVKGQIDLELIDSMTTCEAAQCLMEIKGVGPKVAACVLLFGYGKKDAFPIDVWVKKVLSKYYDEKFSPEYFGKYSGIAQQYLFYYERYLVSKNIISN